MLKSLLTFAITRPVMTLFVVILAAALGLWHAPRLPVDAVPDITNVQVMINTSAPGYSPLEVEQRITYPVETAMAGLPRLAHQFLRRRGRDHCRVRPAHRQDP